MIETFVFIVNHRCHFVVISLLLYLCDVICICSIVVMSSVGFVVMSSRITVVVLTHLMSAASVIQYDVICDS